ncbi:MAG: hypothetical protein A2104_00135 [Candidatus Melainabacteria bacterium GWF2_32_7]|nr:MAG: hypothetical protein A2104_00135 [Candidatus Melainabacteria bacterium GWF2_32_7]OGI17068.1 MAG: hypothetical protein A2255_06780 [Candidatus Melainabacteria bacterium RIFOXYA2_FULL_32_9]
METVLKYFFIIQKTQGKDNEYNAPVIINLSSKGKIRVNGYINNAKNKKSLGLSYKIGVKASPIKPNIDKTNPFIPKIAVAKPDKIINPIIKR